LLARDVMVPDPHVAVAGTMASEVAIMFRTRNISVVPVVDDHRIRRFLGVLSDRDLLIAGTALYAGEGSKTPGELRFANSDPAMIELFLRWRHALFDVDESHLAKYQFGTRSGTVLLCAACGTYAGVILEVDGRMWSVANVRGLAIPQFKGVVAHAVDYDGETVESRIARRKRMWTPTEMTLSA